MGQLSHHLLPSEFMICRKVLLERSRLKMMHCASERGKMHCKRKRGVGGARH